MKFFIDTANCDEIRDLAAMGIVDGVTTNPTLLAKEIERTHDSGETIIKEICRLVQGPVSTEVLSLEAAAMLEEARVLAKLDDHVVVKIPITLPGLNAVRTLAFEGILTNVTLVFTPIQALLAAKAGASYVSPFVGRLDDIGQYGMEIIEQIRKIYDNYALPTQIIVASVRNPVHVLESALLGADVATIPPAILRMIIGHPLTQAGIEKFARDWKKVTHT
jgi:transaldolase